VTKQTGEVTLSVVVVNWNGCDLLSRCLASLESHWREMDMEVFVIDNASTDNSVQMIADHFPNVKVIANSENRGFAAANNQAAAIANGRYLLLLNPDTEVCAGSIQELVNFADGNPDIGAVGPRLLNYDGSIQRSCWRGYPGVTAAWVDALYLWKMPWLPLARSSEVAPDELQDTLDVDHLLGACMLINRSAWDDVGPLDERYFLFLEETEWCRRAKARGWRVVYYPHAAIVHHGQHSMRQQPSRNLPYLYRSYCLFYRDSPKRTQIGLIALKLVIALTIFIRFALWAWRRVFARGESERNQARSMIRGYRQVLFELPSL
jgi:GT2 family glycosyltransferase